VSEEEKTQALLRTIYSNCTAQIAPAFEPATMDTKIGAFLPISSGWRGEIKASDAHSSDTYKCYTDSLGKVVTLESQNEAEAEAKRALEQTEKLQAEKDRAQAEYQAMSQRAEEAFQRHQAEQAEAQELAQSRSNLMTPEQAAQMEANTSAGMNATQIDEYYDRRRVAADARKTREEAMRLLDNSIASPSDSIGTMIAKRANRAQAQKILDREAASASAAQANAARANAGKR